MEIQREIASEKNGLIGQTLDVVEKYDGKSDIYIGRTQFDALEIDGEVFVTGYDGPLEIIQVKITHSYRYSLSGEVV